jgi:hypothetical protein
MKSLRLDIDGVLIRDKQLLERVEHNCAKYVHSKLPECKDPVETNRLLYLAHGHTARGLHQVFKVDTSDFNRKVYDKSLLRHLAEVIDTPEFQYDAAQIHELTRDGWHVSLFTNAPWIWASKVGMAIGDNVGVRCPGNPMDSPLKPEVEAYIFPFDHLNVMVDDSLKNLGTARHMSNWKCVHFTDRKDPSAWCPQVETIWELCLLARSME